LLTSALTLTVNSTDGFGWFSLFRQKIVKLPDANVSVYLIVVVPDFERRHLAAPEVSDADRALAYAARAVKIKVI